MKRTSLAIIVVLLIVIILLFIIIAMIILLSNRESEEGTAAASESMQIDSENTAQSSFSVDSISSLRCSIQHGHLNIVLGDTFNISDASTAGYNAYIENGTYVIEGSFSSDNNFTLTVPKDIVFEQIDLKVTGGYLSAKELSAKNLYTDCTVGAIYFSGTVQGDSEIDCGSGKTTVYLNGSQTDYNYSLTYDRGHININSVQYAGLGGSDEIDNGAEKTLRINCATGSTSIFVNQ